jgi:hypothetical protein
MSATPARPPSPRSASRGTPFSLQEREKLVGGTTGCSTLAPHEPDPAAGAPFLPDSQAVVAAEGHAPVGEVAELRWGSWEKGLLAAAL